MMKKTKAFHRKHRELIAYCIFGLLTTVVNFLTFYAFEAVQGGYENSYLVSNTVAWVVSVIFAYVTGKIFVFRSLCWKAAVVIKELAEFTGARVLSFAIEEIGLLLMMGWLGMDAMNLNVWGLHIDGGLVAKLILATMVVILNYFFSKFVVFKKKD